MLKEEQIHFEQEQIKNQNQKLEEARQAFKQRQAEQLDS